VFRDPHNRTIASMDVPFSSRSSQFEIGRCHMQKHIAYSPISQKDHACSLSKWEFSLLALAAAVMLFMISFTLVNPPSRNAAASGRPLLLSEFSTGMPLP
jgi:hypothetical protein